MKCNSRKCGAGNGVVVLHEFDLETGNLIQTEKFRDPGYFEKRRKDQAQCH